MTKTRRELIEEGFNKPPEQHEQRGLVLKILTKHQDDNLPVGQATAFLQGMSQQELGFHKDLYRRHQEAEELGKHASESSGEILGRIGAHPLVEKFLEGMDTDDVAHALIERRGSDVALGMPEMTRRDILSSALDAHTDQGDE